MTKETENGISFTKDIFEQHNYPFKIKIVDINNNQSLLIVATIFKYSKKITR